MASPSPQHFSLLTHHIVAFADWLSLSPWPLLIGPRRAPAGFPPKRHVYPENYVTFEDSPHKNGETSGTRHDVNFFDKMPNISKVMKHTSIVT